jgi:predicted phosphodiesterase
MANITHKWKKLLGVSCSHAKYIDPVAWDAVLRFKEIYKPDTICHLGDFIDLSALRELLSDCKDPYVFCGNHEHRAWRLMKSKNSVTSYCAHKIVNSIEDTAKKLNARLIPYSGIFQIVDIADIGLTHGTIFNEMAARDMAIRYCNGKRRKICFGHTHKVSIQSANTEHGGTGYNIGTLTARGELDYANTRPSTFAWTQAFLWGEYCESLNQSSLQITQRAHNETWRLPI